MLDDEFERMLLGRLRELLQSVDLSTTTERQLRMSLEEEFEVELSQYKRAIRRCVEEYLQQNHPVEEEGAEEVGDETDPKPSRYSAPVKAKPEKAKSAAKAKRPRGEEEEEEEKIPRGPLYILSPEMTRFVGTDRLQRTQVLKKVWEYIKANQLQEGRSITHDETLAELFDYPLDAGQLMKQMGKHMVEKIEGSALPSAKKRAKDAKAAAKAANPRASGGYQKPIQVSPQLNDFLGVESISRPEAVKQLWAYIKENQLQDPANKKNIICDDRLRDLLGVDKFQGFGMMKYLNRHFITDIFSAP